MSRLSRLPLELKEKILLELPYEDVKFISNANSSFWRKKIKLDFPYVSYEFLRLVKASRNLYERLSEELKEQFETARNFLERRRRENEGVPLGWMGSYDEFMELFDSIKEVFWFESPFTDRLWWKAMKYVMLVEWIKDLSPEETRRNKETLNYLKRFIRNNPARIEYLRRVEEKWQDLDEEYS
jgi:hypothetical protein